MNQPAEPTTKKYNHKKRKTGRGYRMDSITIKKILKLKDSKISTNEIQCLIGDPRAPDQMFTPLQSKIDYRFYLER